MLFHFSSFLLSRIHCSYAAAAIVPSSSSSSTLLPPLLLLLLLQMEFLFWICIQWNKANMCTVRSFVYNHITENKRTTSIYSTILVRKKQKFIYANTVDLLENGTKKILYFLFGRIGRKSGIFICDVCWSGVKLAVDTY